MMVTSVSLFVWRGAAAIFRMFAPSRPDKRQKPEG
jgi:hypothetical protein